jgi:hypothetical protein
MSGFFCYLTSETHLMLPFINIYLKIGICYESVDGIIIVFDPISECKKA